MNLQKYTPNHQGDNSEIFHSNAYARVASGTSMGATTPVSFGSRMDVHRNRQAVRQQGRSFTERGSVQPYAREAPSLPSRVGTPIPPRSPTSFHEPPARHNPYS